MIQKAFLLIMLISILLGTCTPAKADDMPPLYMDYFLPSIQKGGD
jgi:hypothetical protein